MARIRLVALDIDGTLLRSDDTVSPGVIEAVRGLAGRGVAVTLSTGRWYASALRMAGRLAAAAPIISSNGARVTRQDTGEDLLRLTVPTAPAREIAAFADEHDMNAHVAIGDHTFIRARPTVDPARLPAELRAVSALAPCVTEPPTSILVFDAAGIESIPARFEAVYSAEMRFLVNRTSGTSDHLTLCHPDIDKGRALLLVCEHLGIAPDEVMAVGDAASDAAMWAVAGVGVAMGNALPATRELARAVAPTNDEDGVAWAIERFVD